MTSLKEIAKLAGVSKSTVSRYLNNGQVSEKNREKIKKIIEETNYHPNTFARSLKSNQTKLIGVVVPRFNSGSTTSVLTSIDQVANESGYQLIIINSALDYEREKTNLRTLANQKVAGIIFIATRVTDELEEIIASLPVPVILVGQRNDHLSYIAHDDYGAGRKVADHVKRLGHKEALFVGVEQSDYAVGVLRRDGFIDGCQEAGINCQTMVTSFSKSDNYAKAKDYLRETNANYIAAATDHMAISILKAAKELGFSIPERLAVSGFGGYDEFSYYTPGLTTVQYPFEESGQRAFEGLIDLIEKEKDQVQEVLSNELVTKESSLGDKT